MAWEIRSEKEGFCLVAPTELQAWLMFFGATGRVVDFGLLMFFVRRHREAGIRAVEVSER